MILGILIAQIIHPADGDFIAGVAAFQRKSKVGVFGNIGPCVAGNNDVFVMFNRQFLNKMRGDQGVGFGVAITAVFHRVGDQHSKLRLAVHAFGADFDARHAKSRSRQG